MALTRGTKPPRPPRASKASKSRDLVLTKIVLQPLEEYRDKSPKFMWREMAAAITAPALLYEVSYSRNGNLKLQITDITPTTREELSKFGEEFVLEHYDKVIVDRLPAEDYLNDDGSLIEPEHMKDFLEYQNEISLPQVPRALVPKVLPATPRKHFSMVVYFNDPQEYKRVVDSGKLRTPHVVAKVRAWNIPQKGPKSGPKWPQSKILRVRRDTDEDDESFMSNSNADLSEERPWNSARSGTTYYSCLEVND